MQIVADLYFLPIDAKDPQLLINASRRGERACISTSACSDGEMLVVTKNRTKRLGVWKRQLCNMH